MMNVKGEDNSFLPMTDIKLSLERDLLKSEDKWIISRINEAVKDITGNMDKFELSNAMFRKGSFDKNKKAPLGNENSRTLAIKYHKDTSIRTTPWRDLPKKN